MNVEKIRIANEAFEARKAEVAEADAALEKDRSEDNRRRRALAGHELEHARNVLAAEQRRIDDGSEPLMVAVSPTLMQLRAEAAR